LPGKTACLRRLVSGSRVAAADSEKFLNLNRRDNASHRQTRKTNENNLYEPETIGVHLRVTDAVGGKTAQSTGDVDLFGLDRNRGYGGIAIRTRGNGHAPIDRCEFGGGHIDDTSSLTVD
jgi:hypothetical protein